jgi:hypothetical protein
VPFFFRGAAGAGAGLSSSEDSSEDASWSRSIAKQEQQRHRILCLIVVSVVGDMIEQILVFTPV